jgi:hypothetical protein
MTGAGEARVLSSAWLVVGFGIFRNAGMVVGVRRASRSFVGGFTRGALWLGSSPVGAAFIERQPRSRLCKGPRGSASSLPPIRIGGNDGEQAG